MKWITRIFKRMQKQSSRGMDMNLTPSQARKMLEMVLKTLDRELSCDEVHELLDQYTEMAVQGENVEELLPLVHHHLHMCPDCHEEYEALSRILEAQSN